MRSFDVGHPGAAPPHPSTPILGVNGWRNIVSDTLQQIRFLVVVGNIDVIYLESCSPSR